MRLDRKQLISSLKITYIEAINELSSHIGVMPDMLDPDGETSTNGEMVAAMIGIRTSELRMTISVLADMSVIEGSYVSAYADFKGEMLDDEVWMFGKFGVEITKDALNKAGVAGIEIPPPQMISVENFNNVKSNKSAVSSFTLPFELDDGLMIVNVALHA